MDLWLEILLALSVLLVIVGCLGSVVLLVDKGLARRAEHAGRGGRTAAGRDPETPVVRQRIDVRDHGGPIVERRGPGVTERRARDVVDRTSGENPRV